MTKEEKQKLRDDMHFFQGNLDSLQWASTQELPLSPDAIEVFFERYESIVNRVIKVIEND